VFVLRIVESWDGWLATVWEGRGRMRKKKKEKQGKRVSAEGSVYNGFYRWNHRWNSSVGISIGDFVGDSVTSLYGYLSLNPSIIPSVKSSEKTPRHHTVASFQTNFIGRRRYGWYIPTKIFCRYISTISPTELCHRYIPIELPIKKFCR
jgi:hypothetical protein